LQNHKNDQGPDPNPELALKDFKNPRSQQMNFDREAKMLVELNKLNDKHIIKLLFAFTKDDTSGLIFPLAECSLDAYFKNNDPRQYVGTEKAQHTAWIFEQFEGIFKGLARVHGDPRARRETLSPGQEDLVVGYHHDIKPSNILLFYSHEVEKHPFEEPEVQFGRLQLSDFGLGKFRTVLMDGTGTRTIQGTITYRAPECDPEAKDRNQNRKYDIWGIGCVLLELLVWLTEGPEGLNGFASER
jgi:serine/threonine protein kinase